MSRSLTNLLVFVVAVTSASALECGKVKVGEALSLGGEYAQRGQWPWLVPLFKVERDQFFCGSTIISKRHLLSASHCIQDKGRVQPKAAHEIYGILGKYNLKISDEGNTTKVFFDQIKMHPDWNTKSVNFDGDIAILRLKLEIAFTHLVQPICLPSVTARVFAVRGAVAGYGLSDESQTEHESVPKFVQISSVTQEDCLFSEDIYQRISSKRSFCAGERGRNPCRGDSGSGFYVKASKGYEIYGVVSAAPHRECSENQFVIFTSVPQFISWIRSEVESPEGETETALKCDFRKHDEDGAFECFSTSIESPTTTTRLTSVSGNYEKLQDPSKVSVINIVSARAPYIPDLSLANAKFPRFRRLYIVHSGLRHVERRKLAKMPQLTLLNFFGNEIEYLPEDAFDDLRDLEVLAFVQNRVKFLPPKLLHRLPKLLELWAYDNPYELIPRGLLVNNKRVVKLWMGYNKVRRIDENFTVLPKLDVLDLRGNVCIDQQTCISCGAKNFDDIQAVIDRNCSGAGIEWVALEATNFRARRSDVTWEKL